MAHFQDEQTQREIRATYDPSANGGQGQSQVLYQTVGGTWETVYINYGVTHVGGKVYQVEDWDYNDQSVCTHEQILGTDIYVIREIIFPTTESGVAPRKYTFAYNSDTTEYASDGVRTACGTTAWTYERQASKGMGDLSQMVTPTGAVVSYTYSRDSTHYFLFNPDDIPRETVTGKTLIHDGANDHWVYSITEFGGCGGSVTSPDGSTVNENCFPHV